MTTRAVPPPRPALAVSAGVLDLLGALGVGGLALLFIVLGGFADTDTVEWWIYPVLLGAVLQGWGAVRLLRRRGWGLLALGALPSLLVVLALVGLWREYHQAPSLPEFAAAASVLAGALALMPPARRWAGPARARRSPGGAPRPGASR